MSVDEKRVPVRVLGGIQPGTQTGTTKRRMSEFDEKVKGYLERLGDAPSQLVRSKSSIRGEHEHRIGPQPWADLFDFGDEFRVLMEAPGVGRDDVDVALAEQELQITTVTRIDLTEGNPRLIPQENARVKTLRSVPLPEPVIPERAEASLNNGILEIRTPKQTPTRASRHRIIR